MSTLTRKSRRRRSKGASNQPAAPKVWPAYIKRQTPVYDLLNEEGLQKLEDQVEWILSEIGIEFRGDDEALRLFKAAGATVTDTRVQFDRGHARSLCATCLLYTSPSPRDGLLSRMPSSA